MTKPEPPPAVASDGFQGWGEHLKKRVRCTHGCTPERCWYDCPVHGHAAGAEMCPVRVSEDSAGIYRTRCYLVAGHDGKHV